MSAPCYIDILRHGDTPLTGRFCGRSDPSLTDKGRRDLVQQTAHKKWNRVVSSPAQRCSAFAESLPLPVAIDERFQELDFGAWEGMSTEEVWATDQALLKAFWADPTASPPPNGEPWDMLCKRASLAFEELVLSAPGEHVLLITHAGVMRSLLVSQLGLSFEAAWKVALPTASMMQFMVAHDRENGTFHAQLTALCDISGASR